MLPKEISSRGWKRGGVCDRPVIEKISTFCRSAGGGVTVLGACSTVLPNKWSKVFSWGCSDGLEGRKGRGGPNTLRFVSSKAEVR